MENKYNIERRSILTMNNGRPFHLDRVHTETADHWLAVLPASEILSGLLCLSDNTLRAELLRRRALKIAETIAIINKRPRYRDTDELIDLSVAMGYIGVKQSYKHIREQLTNNRIPDVTLDAIYEFLTSLEIKIAE